MSFHDHDFRRVGFTAVVQERGFRGCVVVVVVVLDVEFREIATLGVPEDEGGEGVFGFDHGVREVCEHAGGDAGGGEEFGGIHCGGGEGHDGGVHAVLGCQHAFDGWAVEGKEAVEEGGFEGGRT